MSFPQNVKRIFAAFLKIAASIIAGLLLIAMACLVIDFFETKKERKLDKYDLRFFVYEKAEKLFNEGKIADALPLAEKYFEKCDAGDRELAARLLTQIYERQGRDHDIELLSKRRLTIDEQELGANDLRLAHDLYTLGRIYVKKGRYAEAKPMLERSLVIFKMKRQKRSSERYGVLSQLATLHILEGRHGEAEPYLREIMELDEGNPEVQPKSAREGLAFALKMAGSWGFSNILITQAAFYVSQARYADAESIVERSLMIAERTGVLEELDLIGLNEVVLAAYGAQGHYDEAERIIKYVLAIRERALSKEDPRLAEYHNALASIYKAQGRYGEAEALIRSVVAVREKSLPEGDLMLLSALISLEQAIGAQGRDDEAEAIIKRALAITEKALPERDYPFAVALSELGTLYIAQGRTRDGQEVLERAARILESYQELYADYLFTIYVKLGNFYSKQHAWSQALSNQRRALSILVSRAIHEGAEGGFNPKNLTSSPVLGPREVKLAANVSLFRDFLGVASHLDANETKLINESFEISQWASRTRTSLALAKMAARQAAGFDGIANAARSVQDAQIEWQAADKLLSKALGDGNKAVADTARQQMAALDVRLKQFNERLANDFPKYAELIQGKPASIADTQNVLKPNEALVTFTFGDNETYLFVLRKGIAKFLCLAVKRADISTLVAKLRDSLDPKGRSFDEMPAFDVEKAQELYQKLFGPVDDLIRHASHLIVAADGPLQSLPPALLVTEAPKEPIASPKDYRRYRDVAWLIRRQAVTVIPAVSSLVSLRKHAHVRQATEPFIGFGDPDFGGKGSASAIRGVQPASLFRGGAVNIDQLRKLRPLPETEDELRAEAKLLGAPRSSVHLGKNATVTKVKSLDLSDTRVVAFATHGLVAGEFPELAEPALALTPPTVPTADDDGLLRASEVSQLKLNADWVLLSACNTAAADGTLGAEGLSGLAKAFFYAGARSLLVSHWSVDSAATVKLMTSAFGALKHDPTLGRSEAFRRAMLQMIDDAGASGDAVNRAHPAFWAPFALVGEGAM